ncbi:glycosyltransferase family 4 protein [Colwellia sp. E2M01]|uniref:glycosyltransferase family 4 protein n=1 Tax=Colwellia sp. E2M01 TaxID=2841561 RepID=UPI001C096F16|nr:glycosyltransferase family 4 protein [Colwellia sp. E2M01]MBU2869372.1 glycosyltransferase family 4 protein [Colwellia sp. E2M01]
MKIVIVNTSDINGGAARAAYRLHKALLNQNIDSQMLVQCKVSDDYTVIGPDSKLIKILNTLRPTLDSIPFRFFKNKTKTLFSVAWLPSRNIINKINQLQPDIVHLHWINDGMLRIEDLSKIKAPIVWSLHDMWPLSGGWHYQEPLSSKYQNKLNFYILNRKQKTFSKIRNMTIIGLSKWLQDCARKSDVFLNQEVLNLPNPINTKVFKPCEKLNARNLWSLPATKKLILFGAMGATSDPRKGFNELTQALNLINRTDIEFVIFGASTPLKPQSLGCNVHYTGNLSDDISLITLYSAVDVMIVPSLQENLSNAIMESLACGTPVVSFDIGGNSDLISHKKDGYLAKPYDTKDLANGIEWVIDNKKYSELCSNARDKVLTTFDSDIVANRYIKLYQQVQKD